MNNLLKTLVFTSLVSTAAVGSEKDQDKVVEGKSVPGGFYLGMPKSEVIPVDRSRNCKSLNPCTFRTIYDDSSITLTFEKNRVSRIEILNQDYETTRGANPTMSRFDVAELYEGSEVIDVGFREYLVDASEYGYALKSYIKCPPYGQGPCWNWGAHVIFAPVK